MTETADDPDATILRLRDGLDRLAAVSRTDLRSASSDGSLNPAQVQALVLLAGRTPPGVRVTALAAHLGVSQPSATDTVAALQRKGLVDRAADAADARATLVGVSTSGRSTVAALHAAPSALSSALAALDPGEQAALLRLLVKLIRTLQVDGAIPAQRLCVTCRHFRPNVHADAVNPHHCAFVDAAFGDRLIRLDCSDHEEADPLVQSANWTRFADGSASLRAPPQP